MSDIYRLQFPDEPDFRIALDKLGITGPAQDLLVRDEATNRQHANLSRQAWDSVSSYILIELSKKPEHAKALPSPEMVAAFARLILAAELCAGGESPHPAVTRSPANKHGCNTHGWGRVLAGALRCDCKHGPICIEPYSMGTALALHYHEAPASDSGKIATATIPALGNHLLPRTSLTALVIEALHRISGTNRRCDLPTADLHGVGFRGTGPDWSMLLFPLITDDPTEPQPLSTAGPTGSLIIIPSK